MDLARITGQPVTVEIAGQPYKFSEMNFQVLGRLQQWIKDNTPHPIEDLKPHLKGFSAEDRAVLLENARQDALRWPPKIGTAAGAMALMSSEEGQKNVFHEALRVHQPLASRELADSLYKALERETNAAAAAEKALAKKEGREPFKLGSKATRIFSIAFGKDQIDLDDEDGDGVPKVDATAVAAGAPAGTSTTD